MKENLESFLTTRYDEEETKNDIDALRIQVGCNINDHYDIIKFTHFRPKKIIELFLGHPRICF